MKCSSYTAVRKIIQIIIIRIKHIIIKPETAVLFFLSFESDSLSLSNCYIQESKNKTVSFCFPLWPCRPLCVPFSVSFIIPSTLLQFFCLSMSPGVFALNRTTGVVSTAKPLDYEANSSYVLKVEADSIRVVSSNLRAPSKSKCVIVSLSLR